MIGSQPIRAFAIGLIGVSCASVLGCAGGSEIPGGLLLPADSVVEVVSSVTLAPAADDPIGLASDIAVLPEGVAVADRLQSNVKVFDWEGQLVRSFGRAGTGPGEFRSPGALAALPDGRLAVLDVGRGASVSIWDATGQFVAGWQVAGIPRSIDYVQDGWLIVGGAVQSGGPPGTRARAQAFGLDGTPRGEYGTLPPTGNRWERIFQGVATTVVGNTLLTANYVSNRVTHQSLPSDAEGEWTLADEWYRLHRIEWPENTEGPLTAQQRVWLDTFGRNLYLLVDLIPISANCFAGRVQTSENEVRESYYIVATLSGVTLAVGGRHR